MINGKFKPDESIRSESIKNKIKNFKCLIKYVDLNKELKYKKASIDYNSNAPNYRAIYKLNSKDKIIQKT